MISRIHQMHEQVAPLRTTLLKHPVYSKIDSLESLRVFMEHHIFAVWDFMSLLKVLQQRLSCVHVPWVPSEFHLGTRLVNEIVLAEESDDDGNGGYASHFDLYHRSMKQVGASTDAIDEFVDKLRRGKSVRAALGSHRIPAPVRRFVEETFEIVEANDVSAIASAFTFGREDLLPDVFQRIVDELNVEACGGLDEFKYYLARHIELDGDEHGPMAGRLLCQLCGGDDANWKTAEKAATSALEARRHLWDGISETIVTTTAHAVG